MNLKMLRYNMISISINLKKVIIKDIRQINFNFNINLFNIYSFSYFK